MIKHHRSQTFLSTLILCICMGSLVALSVVNVVGASSLEIYEFELENGNLLEHDESDEDFFIHTCGDMMDDLLSSKSRSKNLDLQNYFFSPVSPPPNHK